MKRSAIFIAKGISAAFMIGLPAMLAACGAPNLPADGGEVEELEIVEATAPPRQIAAINLATQAAATSSLGEGDETAGFAVDNDQESYWQAGAELPQFIELDLGVAVDITRLSLTLYHSAEGQTVHVLYGKGPWADDEYVVLYEFSGVTKDFQLLEYEPATPWSGIQFVKIETTENTAATGWREIMLFSSAEDPFEGEAQDSDGDGLLDFQDWCPDTPGDFANNGC